MCIGQTLNSYHLFAEQLDVKKASKKTATTVPKAFASFFKKGDDKESSDSLKRDLTKKSEDSPKSDSSRKRRRAVDEAEGMKCVCAPRVFAWVWPFARKNKFLSCCTAGECPHNTESGVLRVDLYKTTTYSYFTTGS